jgi:hypothetical protein
MRHQFSRCGKQRQTSPGPAGLDPQTAVKSECVTAGAVEEDVALIRDDILEIDY